jgi:aminopyrrolnitrin oxygenase
MHALPAADQFPAYPASWYLFGTARDLRRGPISKAMLGRRLVAYRTESGRVVVMEASCAHLGADLGGGCVVGDSIQCPFHGWRYGSDGRCNHIPTATDVPRFARQVCYPAVERHGLVFFFNGPEALFELPFFFGEDPDAFVAGRPFQFIAGCTWYMVAAHAFDLQHFASVHDRRLITPLAVDCPAPFARRSRYSALVEGRSIYDRLLRRFVGTTVDISITTWAGTFFCLTGTFRRACSYFLIVSQPLDEERTLVEGIVFARRSRFFAARAVVQPLSLALRRLFTRGYLVAEAETLGHPRYRPGALIGADRDMIDYFQWVAALPQCAKEMQDQAGEEQPEPATFSGS